MEIDADALVDGRLDADAVPFPGLADPEVTFADGASDVAGVEQVQATLTAVDPAGATLTATDTVWVDEVGGRTLVSELGEQDLRLQRIDALDVDDATAAELRAEVLGGGAEGQPVVTGGSCVDVCVAGTVRWTDGQGGTHAVDRAPVEIRAQDGGEVLGTTTTDADGHYEAVVDGAGRDLVVRVRADGPSFALDQHIDSPVSPDVPAGTALTQDLTTNAVDDNNTAFSVRAALVLAGDHAAEMLGGPVADYEVQFPGDSSSYAFGTIRLVRLDRFDGDVAAHELGHHVAQQLEIEDSPGGRHRLVENLSTTRGKSAGTRLAWGEGWPSYFGVSALAEEAAGAGIPTLGDARYQDGEDAEIDIGLEGKAIRGEDNERTVMNVLWDLYDGHDDGRDHVHLGPQAVWDTLDGGDPTTLSEAYALLSPNKRVEAVNCVFTDMNVAPRLDGPASVGAAAPTFRWRRGNGGDFRNDRFSVAFRDVDDRLLHNTPLRPGQSYTVPLSTWRELRASSGGTVRVSVVGLQSDAPVTGPYRGCSRAYAV